MEYFTLAFVGFIAALTPGPDIFYVIREALCKGIKSSLIAVSGILSGNIIYLTLVGLGVATIGKNPYFQFIVGLAGGIYLLKIAVAIFNDKPNFNRECNIKESGFKIYKEALFLNLSNPKAMLFFMVIVTPFLSKSVILSLLSLFIGISLAFLSSAFIFSKIEPSIKSMIIINKISSIIFTFFAIKLFILAYKAFGKI